MRQIVIPIILAILSISCMGEAKEKLKKAKTGFSNATSIVKDVSSMESKIEELKEAAPLTHEQLKSWLPHELDNLKRTAFKTGQAGMYKVNSVEGVFKNEDNGREVKITIVDGAGPTGSMMAAGYGMLGNLDMEEEDEQKHRKAVEVSGVKAQQTYYKKRNSTQLMFSYSNRFLVTFFGNEIGPEESWKLVKQLKLEALVELAE